MFNQHIYNLGFWKKKKKFCPLHNSECGRKTIELTHVDG